MGSWENCEISSGIKISSQLRYVHIDHIRVSSDDNNQPISAIN